MNTCVLTLSLKFSIRGGGGTAKPVANRPEGVFRDLSSYSTQNLGNLLKESLDQMDNTALSRCITKKKRCNIGHKYHANPSHV